MAEQIKKCPLCKKQMVHEFRPFCSKRCKDIDLNRWLSDSYVIQGDDMLDKKSSVDTSSEN